MTVVFKIIVCIMLLFFCVQAFAIPLLFPVQGKLKGQNVADVNGSFDMTFKFYNVASGGTPVWDETRTVDVNVVDVNNFIGVFSTMLGDIAVFDINSDSDFNYLGLAVGVNPEMVPRIRIGSTAFSFIAQKAVNSDLFGGNPVSYFTNAGNIVSGILSHDRYSDTNADTACDGNTVLTGNGECQTITEFYIQPDSISYADANGHYVPYIGADYDLNMGSYSIIANKLRAFGDINFIGLGGNFTFDESTGNVGIGTTSPGEKLDIYQNINNVGVGMRIQNADNSDAYIKLAVRDYSSSITLGGTTGNLNFVTSGYYSFNTNSDSNKFYVSRLGLSTEGIAMWSDDTSGYIESVQDENSAGYGNLIFRVDDEGTADGYFAFQGKSGSERMRIISTGSVGIGTTTPATSAKLDITSTTGALLVSRMTTAQRDALTAANGMILYNTSTNAFNFYENGAWVTGS